MQFYDFSDNSFGVRGVPWMRGIKSIFSERRCSACGAMLSKKPKGVILLEPEASKGTFWPDALGEGGGEINICVSEIVKASFDNAGIKYGRAWEARVIEPYPKTLKDSVPPKYYWIDAPVGMELDYKASGFTIHSVCHACGQKKWKTPSQIKLFLLPETWKGFDVFRFSKGSLSTFCTERVLQLAIEKKWTNFLFKPINSPPLTKPIPYLKMGQLGSDREDG